MEYLITARNEAGTYSAQITVTVTEAEADNNPKGYVDYPYSLAAHKARRGLGLSGTRVSRRSGEWMQDGAFATWDDAHRDVLLSIAQL